MGVGVWLETLVFVFSDPSKSWLREFDHYFIAMELKNTDFDIYL